MSVFVKTLLKELMRGLRLVFIYLALAHVFGTLVYALSIFRTRPFLLTLIFIALETLKSYKHHFENILLTCVLCRSVIDQACSSKSSSVTFENLSCSVTVGFARAEFKR